jgi:hypothetical protein
LSEREAAAADLQRRADLSLREAKRAEQAAEQERCVIVALSALCADKTASSDKFPVRCIQQSAA